MKCQPSYHALQIHGTRTRDFGGDFLFSFCLGFSFFSRRVLDKTVDCSQPSFFPYFHSIVERADRIGCERKTEDLTV